MDILSLFIIIPILSVIALLFSKGLQQTRVISMIGGLIQLGLSIYLLFIYLKERSINNDIMLFTKDIIWFKNLNIHYAVGVDGISVSLLLLTSIVVLASIFISWKTDYLPKEFFISLIVLSTGVYGFFISIDLFTMFVFYEIAVIPMYLLIGIWGSGNKEYSAMKLTLMLMGASAILLIGILGIYFNSNSDGGVLTFNILEISNTTIPFSIQKIFFPLIFIGFAVLGALFPFHSWSPDGHASAPTAVSMLHAGVLMKLGGYGIFRIALFLLPEGAIEWSSFFIILSVIGIIYGAFAALKQTDLKYINAYSSVSHLGMVLFALLMFNKTAWNGAILQSISHGFMTALFFAIIGIIYSRTNTRDITKLGGLLKTMPFVSIIYLIAGLSSLGLPGFSGFVAEMNIFVGAFQHEELFYRIFTIISISAIVITAVYILQVVGIMLMGQTKNNKYSDLEKTTWFETTSILLLLIPMTIIGIAPLWLSDMTLDSIQPFIKEILNHL